MRVLAFLASRHRPLFLRTAVLQMGVQTHPVDLAIFINSDRAVADYLTDYRGLLDDLHALFPGRLSVGFGKSQQQHYNHVAALAQVPIEDYDLFLKIDDDDVYRRTYVEEAVADYRQNGWDLAGITSQGMINGLRWRPERVLETLGPPGKHSGLGSTWAFSRQAIHAIRTTPPRLDLFEDAWWGMLLESSGEFRTALRRDPGRTYQYNVHGDNVSTGSWLEQEEDPGSGVEEPEPVRAQERPSVAAVKPPGPSEPAVLRQMTVLQSVRLALRLLWSAARRVPSAALRRLRRSR